MQVHSQLIPVEKNALIAACGSKLAPGRLESGIVRANLAANLGPAVGTSWVILTTYLDLGRPSRTTSFR